MTIYFTSDLHFRHSNIIKLESKTRPFKTVEDMDAKLIEEWNELITKEDIVYFLGDFSFNSKWLSIVGILEQLNFKEMKVILGNHDNKSFVRATKEFSNITISYADRIKYEGKLIYLSHYPMMLGERKNLFNLHGHIHSNESPEPTYQYNVGYDYTSKIAISIEDINKILDRKELQKTGRKHG